MGKMRTGKDTIFDLMNDYTAGNSVRYAFGDELKYLYHLIFGYDENGKDREGYQDFGQYCRKRYPDIWVDRVLNKVAQDQIDHRLVTKDPYPHIVVTDLRQPNEWERLKAEGFIIVKVHTDDDIRIERMRQKGDSFKIEDLNHETELYIDKLDYDYLIENNGSNEDLFDAVLAFMVKVDLGEFK